MSDTSASADDGLESMTKAQLAAYAMQNGIAGVSTAQTKAEMIATIRSNQ